MYVFLFGPPGFSLSVCCLTYGRFRSALHRTETKWVCGVYIAHTPYIIPRWPSFNGKFLPYLSTSGKLLMLQKMPYCDWLDKHTHIYSNRANWQGRAPGIYYTLLWLHFPKPKRKVTKYIYEIWVKYFVSALSVWEREGCVRWSAGNGKWRDAGRKQVRCVSFFGNFIWNLISIHFMIRQNRNENENLSA